MNELAVDWLEMNLLGDMIPCRWDALRTHGNGPMRIGKHEFQLCNGRRHGPDFAPLRVRYRDWFDFLPHNSPATFGARATIFPAALERFGLAGSFSQFQGMLRLLGFRAESEQISRVDLRVDVPVEFEEFRARIERGCLVTRLHPDLPKLDKFPTSLYFGHRRFEQLHIYNKRNERKREGITVDHPWTRIETRYSRRFLRRQGVESFESLDVESIHSKATSSFRITDRPPNPKQHARVPSWKVWEKIRQARFNG